MNGSWAAPTPRRSRRPSRVLEMKAAALVPLAIVGVGFVVFCLVDVLRAQRVRYLPKWAWALICLLSVPLGGIAYLVLGRER